MIIRRTTSFLSFSSLSRSTNQNCTCQSNASQSERLRNNRWKCHWIDSSQREEKNVLEWNEKKFPVNEMKWHLMHFCVWFTSLWEVFSFHQQYVVPSHSKCVWKYLRCFMLLSLAKKFIFLVLLVESQCAHFLFCCDDNPINMFGVISSGRHNWKESFPRICDINWLIPLIQRKMCLIIEVNHRTVLIALCGASYSQEKKKCFPASFRCIKG